MSESVIVGRHAVKEALQGDRDLNKILIQDGVETHQISDILKLAKKKKVVVQTVPKNKIESHTTERHQGILAFVSAFKYMSLETLIENVNGKRANLLLLDGLEDPHNLGSILRTADGTGFDAVIIPNRRSVQVTETVARVSVGAVEYVPVVRVTNVNQAIDRLKEEGFWTVGTTMDAPMDYREYPADINTVLIIGNEGEGISKKTLEKCDFKVTIPMVGKISSLNASVSAGILMYEVYRKQHPLKG